MVRGFYDVKMNGETLFKRVKECKNLVRVLKIYSRTTAQEMPVYYIKVCLLRNRISAKYSLHIFLFSTL